MKCKIIKEIGTISETKDYAIKLQLISWDGNPAKFDLRPWTNDNKAKAGVTLTKDELLRIVDLFEGESDDKELPINQPIEEDEEPVEESKTEIDCNDFSEKLDSIFESVNNQLGFSFICEELKKLAREDDELAEGIMQEGKTFEGLMRYEQQKTQELYKDSGLSCGCITEEYMIPFSVEYFKKKEAEKKAPTASKKTTSKSMPKKTTTKKATKRVVKPLEIVDDDEVEGLPFN